MFSAIWRGSMRLPCPLQLLTSLKSFHLIQFEVPNHLPTLPHRDLCKTEPHSPDPNLPFTFEPTKHHQIQSKYSEHIPSLKPVFTLVISSLIDHILLRLTRRGPSPDLVGLATRLSVVWCYPRSYLSQPEVDLGPNKAFSVTCWSNNDMLALLSSLE